MVLPLVTFRTTIILRIFWMRWIIMYFSLMVDPQHPMPCINILPGTGHFSHYFLLCETNRMSTNKSQIYSDSGRYHIPLGTPFIITPHFKSLVSLWNQCQILPIKYRGGPIPLYLARQCRFMSLNSFYTAIMYFTNTR